MLKFTGKLFGRQMREDLSVTDLRAARAVFQGSNERDRIEVELQTDLGILTLDMPAMLAHKLVREVSAAYTAANPPLEHRNPAAGWAGGDV